MYKRPEVIVYVKCWYTTQTSPAVLNGSEDKLALLHTPLKMAYTLKRMETDLCREVIVAKELVTIHCSNKRLSVQVAFCHKMSSSVFIWTEYVIPSKESGGHLIVMVSAVLPTNNGFPGVSKNIEYNYLRE